MVCVAFAPLPATDAFAGIRVVALDAHPGEGIISKYSTSLLGKSGARDTPTCSELTARGLLQDEGVGLWDSITMTYFFAIDRAEWLNV